MNETFTVSCSKFTNDGEATKTNNNNNSTIDSEHHILAFDNDHEREKSLRRCVYSQRLLIVFLCACTILSVTVYICVLGPIFFESTFKFHRFNASAIQVQHFRLRFEPDLAKGTFQGRASIVFKSHVRTKELILVAHSLTVSSVSLTRRSLVHFRPTHTEDMILQRKQTTHVNVVSGTHFTDFGAVHVAEMDPHEQLLRIQVSHVFGEGQYAVLLKDPLDPLAEYMLDMHFSGFHLQHQHWLSLQSACRSFPFFENGKRTIFEVSVTRPMNMTALSNTKVRETEKCKMKECMWEHFEITPPLQPSALGLILCDYKVIGLESEGTTTRLNIYVPEHFVPDAKYVSMVFPIVFHYFEQHFRNAGLHMDKLDLVLTDDEPSEAKLGLIMLHSEQMLLNSVSDNIANRRRILNAVSQAVALQWLRGGVFHDADDSHLLGASRFLAYLTDNATSDAEDTFLLSVMQPTLKRAEESFGINHPMTVQMKFACVLRMAKGTLGEERFKQEMDRNLADIVRANFSTTTTANISLMNIVASWMQNPGYPVIRLSRGDGWMVSIEQKCILQDHDFSNITFLVPLTYVSQSEPTKVHNLTLRESRLQINLNVKPDEWILMNFNQTGFYRVNYDQKTWNMLIRQLHDDHTKIPAANRAELISDAFALSDASLLNISFAFKLLKYLNSSKETEFLVWQVVIDSLNRYELSFFDSTDYGIFRKFKVDLLSPLWLTRHHYNPNLKHLIEKELCKLQFKPCMDSAIELYDKHKHRKDVDVASWVYCTAIRSHDEDDFDLIFNQAKSTHDQRLRRKLLQSLACSTLPWKLNSLFELSLSSKTNAMILWPSFALNEISRWAALQFLEEKWKRLTQFLDDETKADIAVVIIDSYLSTFTTTINLKKVQMLCNNSNDVLHRHFQNAIANIVRQIEWSTSNSRSFIHYLLDDRV